MDSTK